MEIFNKFPVSRHGDAFIATPRTTIPNEPLEEEDIQDNSPTLLSGEIVPEVPAYPQRYYTTHNIRDRCNSIREDQLAKEEALIERTERIRKRMYNSIDKLWVGASSDDQKSILLYVNPRYNPQLEERYAGDLEPDEYPQIRSFLSILPISTAYRREQGMLTEDMYEKELGGGYFTFRII